MRADTQRKIVLFFVGLLLVSILTALGTIAFIGPHATSFVRNIVITDTIFVALFTVWAKVTKTTRPTINQSSPISMSRKKRSKTKKGLVNNPALPQIICL